MIKNELTLAKLYQVYANHLANTRFWKELEQEERIHSQWLKALTTTQGGENGQIYFDVENFNIHSLSSSIDYIENIISREAADHDLKTALGVSLSLENSMIEKEYFKVFKSNSESVNHVLNDLKEETEQHAKRIEQEMQRKRI